MDLTLFLCCLSDLVYCGVYDNALDNDNYNVARGFNYHQGPVSPCYCRWLNSTSAEQNQPEQMFNSKPLITIRSPLVEKSDIETLTTYRLH